MSGFNVAVQSHNDNSQHASLCMDFNNFSMLQDPHRRRSRKSQSHKNENVRVEDQKLFVCDHPNCSRMFSSKFKLDRHSLIHSEVRNYVCGKCGKRFHRKDHLKNHFEVHNVNKPKYACDFCPKSYSSIMSYRKHSAYHSAESGDPVCKICGEIKANRESILQHLKVHSTSRTLRGPAERKYPCDRCDRSFFTKKDVKRHLVVHTGDRDFVCDFCPQRFGRKDHLVRHKKKGHSLNSSSSPTDNNNKYISSPILTENLKPDIDIISSSIPDLTRLDLPQPLQPMVDSPLLDVCKADSYMTPPNLIQSYNVGNLSSDGQIMSRFAEPSLLPVSQYVPMNHSYSPVSTMMSHHYLNVPTPTNMLQDLLPPMAVAPSFTGVTLDMGNPPLPHFSQAFHQ